LLLSAQNPESGTVTYTYHPDGTMATKVDAKGQKTELVYDSYKRVTQVKKYPSVGAPEDEAARVELSYDTNPYEAGYSAYAAGRLTARLYKVNGLTFAEMYSYTRPGQVTKKKLRVGKYFEQPYPYPGSWAYGSLEGRWEYNAEGKMTKVTYPTAAGGGGQSYVYGYDALGRLKTMGPQEAQTSVVSDVTYGPAGEMLTMTGVVNESRGYNSRLQLTSFNGVSYGYGASNNGRIASETVSGETVVYQYDELNRLMKAETQGNVWGQQFTYDGFGNLTNKSVTKGSAPSMSVVVDAQTNRVAGYPYDANGNQLWTNTQTLSYDYENRIAWVDNRNFTGRMYGYDADNRRVYEADWTLVDGTAVFGEQAVHFWGVTGQRLASYGLSLDAGQPPYYGPSVTLTLGSDRVYFGGRLLRGESGWTGEDRLGSVGQFYPYGEARVGDPKRFATYERDDGGLDYAVNRYYWVGTGRFMSPDPSHLNVDVFDPRSWNFYLYVNADPVNFNDPSGLGFWSNFWKALKGALGVPSNSGSPLGGDGVNDRDKPEALEETTEDSEGGAACVYSVVVFAGEELTDALSPDAACVLKRVHRMTEGPVNALLVGGLLIPATFTGVGQLSMAGLPPVVLGSGPWVQIGGVVGGRVLNVPQQIWAALTRPDQQRVMSGWIDSALRQGQQIIFTENPALAPAGSGLAFEYQYILSLGKQIVQSGTSWVVLP
jgi:RHS repeat-associated protein